MEWEYQNFHDKDGFIGPKLRSFLNKNNIEHFVIVQMLENYVEIVYELPNVLK